MRPAVLLAKLTAALEAKQQAMLVGETGRRGASDRDDSNDANPHDWTDD
jgi:hypothetical protein